MSSMGADLAQAYLCMLAVDSILGFVTAMEALVDNRTAEKGHVSEGSPPDTLTCVALVGATWQKLLPVLARLLAAASSEALTLLLLKVPPPLPSRSEPNVVYTNPSHDLGRCFQVPQVSQVLSVSQPAWGKGAG
jgi:hypothetical protein